MTTPDLEVTALALVAEGKGVLAADETVPTLTRRFDALKVECTAESRRVYREMFCTTPGIAAFVSGIILQDETVYQRGTSGTPLTELLLQQGILPGIKVDHGVKQLAGCPGETVTEGLDGLRDRLKEYRQVGARFAKWRAAFRVDDVRPTLTCVQVNAHALARYAALCQEQAIVPIVEPEVLMEGSHTIERSEEVTGLILSEVFRALHDQKVIFERMLLKPNLIMPGRLSTRPASVSEVAVASLRCLYRNVPAAVPGIVFLSGGQNYLLATQHLDAINRLDVRKPWKLSFSYGRALQDEAFVAWRGTKPGFIAGQRAFHHRAKCVSAATLGQYDTSMERESAVA
jgi:fructose-bisphosphate aldolase class I